MSLFERTEKIGEWTVKIIIKIIEMNDYIQKDLIEKPIRTTARKIAEKYGTPWESWRSYIILLPLGMIGYKSEKANKKIRRRLEKVGHTILTILEGINRTTTRLIEAGIIMPENIGI